MFQNKCHRVEKCCELLLSAALCILTKKFRVFLNHFSFLTRSSFLTFFHTPPQKPRKECREITLKPFLPQTLKSAFLRVQILFAHCSVIEFILLLKDCIDSKVA